MDRIEAWRGQRVIDPGDEDLGKLEDVFFDTGTGTPLLLSVKSGLLGRRSTLIPIEGATVGPDYVRVSHTKEMVSRAGDSRGDGPPRDEELAALGSAYGLRFADRVHLESATQIEQTRAEAEAARARADQLEGEAQQKIAAHEAAREQARSAGESVGQADREAAEARQAALEARQHAERYGQR
ncbi:MAG TPA: PRC-barrel domain-containing protein [Solirubrobacteraceae bacterium]|nr:PRC-barrel domain-containing protein [Solirubrobacteraceae bacterium]